MSSRIYPLYQKGNPQLRVFLPNFWMKLVRPTHKLPPNIVQFSCSMEMTRYDIKNYLEKIYDIKSVEVKTRIAMGKTKKDRKGYVIKDDDVKLAYVVLSPNEHFEFPDLFPKSEHLESEKKTVEEAKKLQKKFLDSNKNRGNLPSWFGV